MARKKRQNIVEHDKRFKALENSEWIFDADEVIICVIMTRQEKH